MMIENNTDRNQNYIKDVLRIKNSIDNAILLVVVIGGGVLINVHWLLSFSLWLFGVIYWFRWSNNSLKNKHNI